MHSSLSIPRFVSNLSRHCLVLGLVLGACESSTALGDSPASNEESTPKQSSKNTKESEGGDGEAEAETGSSLPSESPSKSDATIEDSVGESTDASSLVSMTATVVDLESAALEGALVSMCGPHESDAGCVSELSIEDGTVWIESPFGPGSYTIAINPGFAQDGLFFSPVVFSVQLELDNPLNIKAPLVFPQTGSTPLLNIKGTTEARIDDELTLIVNAETFNTPEDPEKPYLAGVRLQPEQWPSYHLSSKDQEVLGIWALNPTGAFIESGTTPIGVKLANTYALPGKTEVRFHGVDPVSGELKLVANGTVSEDGMVIETLDGEGIESISWLVLTAPRKNCGQVIPQVIQR